MIAKLILTLDPHNHPSSPHYQTSSGTSVLPCSLMLHLLCNCLCTSEFLNSLQVKGERPNKFRRYVPKLTGCLHVHVHTCHNTVCSAILKIKSTPHFLWSSLSKSLIRIQGTLTLTIQALVHDIIIILLLLYITQQNLITYTISCNETSIISHSTRLSYAMKVKASIHIIRLSRTTCTCTNAQVSG